MFGALAFAGSAQAAHEEMIDSSYKGNISQLTGDKNGIIYFVYSALKVTAVYSLTPPPRGKTIWKPTDISQPTTGAFGGLSVDQEGNLYGAGGGPIGTGSIFELSPPAGGNTMWTQTVLATFDIGDSQVPVGPLLRTADGTIFGITQHFQNVCPPTCGEVFRYVPPSQQNPMGSFTILYAFSGGADGAQPSAGLVRDGSGAIYGVAQLGGMANCSGSNGCGTVFKLAPAAKGQTAWTESTIHTFTNIPDGALPVGPLSIDRYGNIYGATFTGGSDQCRCGIVFELTPPGNGGTVWQETIPYSFNNIAPQSGPSLVDGGSLVGVTPDNVYRLTPPGAQGGNWSYRNLYTLNGSGAPTALLPIPREGMFWSNDAGGKYDHGGVFGLIP